MKTHSYIIPALTAILFMAASCAKEVESAPDTRQSQSEAGSAAADEENMTPDGEGTVTLQFRLPDNPDGNAGESRISLSQDADANGPVKLAWELGDVIHIIDHDDASASATFVCSAKTDDHNASFTGKLFSAETYDVLYGAESVAAATAVSFSEQTQSGNASTAHLPYIALLDGVTLDPEETVSFDGTWAGQHGGTFRQTGLLRLRVLLPDAVGSISSVTLKAPSALFYTTNALGSTTDVLTLNFSSAADISSDHILAGYLALPWADVAMPAGTDLTMTVVTADHDFYHQDFSAGGATLTCGKVNAIRRYCDNPGTNVTLDDFAGGSGVEGDPYLIGNERQMRRMDANMTAGSVTWFELIDDITMSDTDWTALNNTATDDVFSKYIHFDGKGKTIGNLHASGTYASLFGVLNGTVKDLTLDGAVITPGSTKAGVLAGFIGSGGTQDVSVSGITIRNSSVGTSTTPGTGYCGILAAQAGRAGATVSDVTLSQSRIYTNTGVGGVLAYVAAGTTLSDVTVSGCTIHTSSTTTSTSGADNNHSAGGLIGRNDASLTINGTNLVENTDVSGYYTVGGAIGYINSTAMISGVTFRGNGTKGIVTGSNKFIGGFAGSAAGSGTVISDCRVEYATIDASSVSNDPRAAGFAGQIADGTTVKGCSVGTAGQNVTVQLGTPAASEKVLNSGGFVGVHYGTVTKNGDTRTTVYATVTCTNSNTGWRLNVGGFGGYIRGTVEYCDATVTMTGLKGTHIGGFGGYATSQANTTPCLVSNCTLTGSVTGNKYTGGFVGWVDAGTIQKCSSACTVTTNGDYSGGLIGYINGNSTISDSYVTGNITATGHQRIGGLIGQIVNTTASVTNCYASGTITGSFGLGGLIGRIEGSNVTVSHCAAWNNRVTPSDIAQSKWSSGAVVGVAFPTCTLTDNYRRPDMALKAWWGTETGYTWQLASNFQHPDVSTAHPLVIKHISGGTERETTATAIANGQDNYPQFAYHGKVELGTGTEGADKTLSQLASTTLGWSSEVWDFTGDLPTLKNNPQ